MKGTRRDFFGQSARIIASGIIGSSVLGKVARGQDDDSDAGETKPTSQPATTQPSVDYRILGRTGLNVSTVSLGSIGVTENVVRYAVDHGINFIHTSIDYGNGKAIREVGKGIKGKDPARSMVGLKVVWSWVPKGDGTLDKSLRLLGRDCVDVIFFNIHNHPDKVASPEAREAFERWKKAGKVRFMGLTTHAGMKECMESALETGWYDVLMPLYNLPLREELLGVCQKALKKNVGVVTMKTKASESNPDPIPVILKDKCITTVCKSMQSFSEVKKYIEASKQQVADADAQRIIRTASLSAVGRCRMCGTCTGTCKNGLAVNDIVRSVDYYVDTMGDYETGHAVYHEIEARCNADQCRDCGQCELACPNRVPIRHYIKRSREMFA